MGFETPSINTAESQENNSEKYYKEALEIAQRLSKRWQSLREAAKKEPGILSGQLAEINDMTRPPRSGIQTWFESKVDSINQSAGSNENAKSRMMYRLKEDLEQIERQVDDLLP